MVSAGRGEMLHEATNRLCFSSRFAIVLPVVGSHFLLSPAFTFSQQGPTSDIGFGGPCGEGRPVSYPKLTVEQAKDTCCAIRARGQQCMGFSFVVPVRMDGSVGKEQQPFFHTGGLSRPARVPGERG